MTIPEVLGVLSRSLGREPKEADNAARRRSAYHARQFRQGHNFSLRSILRALRRLDDRLNDLWIGDLIGTAALFVLLFVMSILVGALQ